MADRHPDHTDLVPSPEGITTDKLDGATILSDTCNAAQKVRQILVDLIDGANDYDCMHHLHNVWFGNMEKALTKTLNTLLRDNLDDIDPKL